MKNLDRSKLELPWFGVTKEGGSEGKYSIISIPVYDKFETAKAECRRVNNILDEYEKNKLDKNFK